MKNTAHLLAFVLALALGGCAIGSSVALPVLPAWRTPQNQRAITWVEVANAVATYAPGAQLITSDSAYTVINATTAREIIDWTRRAMWVENKQGPGLAWTAEAFDCDKFAKLFTIFLEISAARAGVKAQPLACRISVLQNAAFGGVPAMPPPNGHALVALATDAGILIVEPQSGEAIPLEQYPNRGSILRVSIGG
jgi:hypothetical protein